MITILAAVGLLGSCVLCNSVGILDDSSLPSPKFEFTKTLKSPYYFSNDNSTLPFYSLHGDAKVTSNSVTLTPDASGTMGAVWSKTPSNLKEWAAVLSLKVTGASPLLGSEGLAFWYAEQPGVLGPIFGSKDRWNGLGVFFDTHDNDKKKDNPAILAVYNSANYDYPFAMDGMHHTFAHCFREFRNTFMPFLVKITYLNKTLTVEVDAEGHGYDYEKCFSYSPIYLNPGFYFGVSAASGEFPDRHELMSMEVFELNAQLPVNTQPILSKKLDESATKKHDAFQHRLHDIVRKREADDIQKETTNMKFLEKMVKNIEENQMDMHDKIDDLVVASAKIANLERQITSMNALLTSLTGSVNEIAGHQSGSRSVIDHVAQLNQIAHNKLAYLEENSRVSHDKADALHSAFAEKEHSNFWWYVALIALQLLIIMWLVAAYKKDTSVSKKFI